MQPIIRSSTQFKRNYKEISDLCKETHSPVFLTKNGSIDLVAMDIDTYDARQHSLELREKLVDIAERRLAGRPDYDAHEVLSELRNMHE